MKKALHSSLISLLALGFIAGCSNSQSDLPLLNQNVVTSSSTEDVNNKYVVTAQAIIDKMPTVTSAAEQEKLIKDFIPLIKSLNRFALDKLTKYAVKVLQANLKPGEQANQTPVAKLIHPILSRQLDITQKLSFAHVDLMSIGIEKDSAKQEKLIVAFEASLKKLVKADIKDLISSMKGENGNLNDFIPLDSALSKRILKMLEARL